MTKFKAWVSAARLRTLPLSVSGIVTAGAVAKDAGVFSVSVLILAILTTLGFQILSNFANDYGDGIKGTDNKDRVGPARALQSGLLTARELKYGMIITSGITLFLSTLLIFSAFGNKHIVLAFIFFNLGIAAMIAAVKYTVGKNAYGYRAMGDIFVFIFFGLVGVVGCYFLFAISFSNFIFLPAITIGMWSTAVLNLNNMRDRIPDKAVGKNTLAVVLGATKAKKYHYALLTIGVITAIFYMWINNFPLLRYGALIVLLPLILHILKVIKNDVPAQLDPELKKVALSTFLFSVLLFIGAFL